MSDSERYVPPPPPYELALQKDHKVTDEVQALEVSKGGPFQEEKDSKHARALSDKTPAIQTFPSIPKRPGGGRPLPPSPANARLLGPRRKFGSIADLKSYAAQSDHATEPHPPVLRPFSEAPYARSMHHPSTSPFHYPYQSSYDSPRRNRDDPWPVSTYFPMEPYAETSLRRPAHMSSQSPPYPPPQDDDFGTRLSFDPSVAYSGSQVNTRAAFATQRGVAASLYSSAVSSHLRLDSTMNSGFRQSLVPRPALWSTARLSARSSGSSSPTSLYAPRTRTYSEYEQRWATSESDITRAVYHD